MRYDVEINGRLRRVDVCRADGRFSVALDATEWAVDAVRVDRHTWSLLIGDGRSYPVTVVPAASAGELAVSVGAVTVGVRLNPRRRHRSHDSVHHGVGPQRIVAPMPGKIVRVLVESGERVRVRQPIIVIEAMKMENELRAQVDGVVVEVHGREGQSVEAGTLVAVVEARS
jgi:biotin carboxyl carrier protein